MSRGPFIPVRALNIVAACLIMAVASNGRAWAKLHVAVSIMPQKYFVERIGAGHVDVTVMVPAGADIHTYEPRPQQLVALSKARLYFAIGVEFEDVWLGRLTGMNPSLKVVGTGEGIRRIPMPAHLHDDGHEEHAHAEESAATERPDPHIWLSPPLVIRQCEHIYNALAAADPHNRDEYRDNYRTFIDELMALDRELRTTFRSAEGVRFMVFHPAWGYFASAYGLTQIPVEAEGKEPSPGELAAIIEHARELGIRVMFAQPQLSARSANTIAREIDGEVVTVDPLSEDWMRNIRRVADMFGKVLR